MDAAKLDDNVRPASAAEEPEAPANEMDSLLDAVTTDLGNFVRQSPVLALGGAFAVGHLVAKLARAVK